MSALAADTTIRAELTETHEPVRSRRARHGVGLSGFTDSHFIRDLGIPAYGYSPTIVPHFAVN